MLDSKQCDAFYAVIESGSFEHAAKKLNLTASAVSLRVQSLEKQLGLLLLNRTKPCTTTKSGQILLEHLRHTRLLEQNLHQELGGKIHDEFIQMSIAVNADTLATWILPLLHKILIKEKITLEFLIDDQDHTYQLLETGVVSACLSTQHKAMNGCEAKYLGAMQYKMYASKNFQSQWFADGVTRQSLRAAPAIIFNEKDQLHIDTLLKLFGLPKGTYPFFSIPTSESFVEAIHLGLGYGMAPVQQIEQLKYQHDLIEILPEACTEIPLYWHYWKKQSPALHILTQHLLEHAPSQIY
ncbi:LysR family transcriptional regulator, chromosome initiation inhibitor [Acinetobacter marinus]|uniref:LysR family transcriptional regulator, chromosome initiation inhibitor n=1 Tax=Acinetobacter marinus TaxID=281375 RepID=A0A1G6GKC5_9GAMM|nr:LysR family transcriptional regulator ArgP [Acinetobacter marinus]SDB82195.1 LysR family transcriptional regulator, chromosome initiation inhibitor [Acinetobacter marinus]